MTVIVKLPYLRYFPLLYCWIYSRIFRSTQVYTGIDLPVSPFRNILNILLNLPFVGSIKKYIKTKDNFRFSILKLDLKRFNITLSKHCIRKFSGRESIIDKKSLVNIMSCSTIKDQLNTLFILIQPMNGFVICYYCQFSWSTNNKSMRPRHNHWFHD